MAKLIMKKSMKYEVYSMREKRGFTVLFAVLISSILLSIGIAILDLTLKQFTLSSVSKDSQIAFYAADTGQECAMYWDHVNDQTGATSSSSFATSSASVVSNPPSTMTCEGSLIDTATAGAGNYLLANSNNATTTFWIHYVGGATSVSAPCASIVVSKTSNTDGSISTVIQTKGYNTCDPNNRYRTERGLKATY